MADDINIDEIQSRLDELASTLDSAASRLSSSMDDTAKSSKKSAQAEDQATAATNKSTQSLNSNTTAVNRKTEAEKKAEEQLEEYNAAVKSAKASMGAFANNLLDSATGVDKGFAKYGSGLRNVGSAAVTLGDEFGAVGMVAGRAVAALTAFATVGLEVNQAISDTRVQINKFAGVLPISQAQLGEMAAAAQFSGTDIKKFGDVLSGLGPNVLGLGGNAADASVRFLEIANVSDDVRRQFSRMGIEQERLVELQGEYGALQAASGVQALQELKTDKQIQKESLKYAESLSTISEITGLTAEQQRAEAEAVQRDLREKLATARELQKANQLEAQGRQAEADAIRAEIEKRKDAQNQLASYLGSDMAIQISQALRTGSIDPTNAALAQLGISASELTKINEDSANGQEAAAKVQDLVFEKVGDKINSLGRAADYMSDEQLKAMGLSRELVDNYAAYANRQESLSEKINAAELRRQKKLQEATDLQVDNQAELSLAEAAFREEFNAIATEIGARILPIFTKLYGIVQPVISIIGDLLTPAFDVLVSVLNPVLDVLGVVFDVATTLLTPFVRILGTGFKFLSSVIDTLFTPLKYFGKLVNYVATGLKDSFNDIYDIVETGLLFPIRLVEKAFDGFYDFTTSLYMGAFDLLMAPIRGLTDAIQSVIDWFTDFANPIEAVTSAFQSVVDWFSNLSFSDILPDIKLPSWLGGGGDDDDDKDKDKKEDEGPGFFSRLGDTISGVGGAAFDALSGVGGTLTDAFSGIGGTVTDAFSGIGGTITDSLSGIGGTITDSLSGIGGTVTDVVGTAFDVATAPARLAFEGLQSVAGTVTDTFSGIGGTISDSLSGIGGTVTDAFSGIGGTLTDAFSGIGGTITDSLSGIGGTITDSLSGIGGTVTDVVGTAFDVATAPARLAFEGLQTVAGTVTDTFSGIGGTISDSLSGVGETVTNAVGSAFESLSDIGGTISDTMGSAFDTVTAPIVSVFDTLKDVAGSIGGIVSEKLKESFDLLYDSYDSTRAGLAGELDTITVQGSRVIVSIDDGTIVTTGGEINEKDFSTRTQSRDEIIKTKDYFREGARAVELDSSVKMLVDSSPLDSSIPNATDRLVDDVVQQTEATPVTTTDTAPTEQSKDTSLLEQLVQSQQMMINSLGSKLDNIVSALDDGNDTQAKILRNTY